MQRNVEPSAVFFQAFNSVTRNFTGNISQCFEDPIALSLSLFLPNQRGTYLSGQKQPELNFS